MARYAGLSDREITDTLLGPVAPQQAVNQACRALVTRGAVRRSQRADGRLGNYLAVASSLEPTGADPPGRPRKSRPTPAASAGLSEDAIKHALRAYLERDGWQVEVAWGKRHGTDIVAMRGSQRWHIEAKGSGSRPEMRVNYFLAILGELLQRTTDPSAKHSIALPEMRQFRRLWERLPPLAKSRTGISALFVDEDGHVVEVS